MEHMTQEALAKAAVAACKLSYSPYSRFTVGAALLCRDGTVFTGANIENAAFSATMCAERTAFFSALTAGKRDFEAIAIAGKPESSDSFSVCAPCGECRQVMREFCEDSFQIILTNGKDIELITLGELLPHSFTSKELNR